MAPKKNYKPEQMAAALGALERGIHVSAAAKEFNVPRVTLLYKWKEKSPRECSMGPSTTLTAMEENILVQWIIAISKLHYPITKDQLKENEKKKKQEEKEQKARVRVEKRAEKEKAKIDSESSDEEDSLDDVTISEEKEYCELDGMNNVSAGDYVLVKFFGGKRKTTQYRYVCVVQNVLHKENEIKVMSMKVSNTEKDVFRVDESDVSLVEMSATIGKLPSPEILVIGDRVKCQFSKPVDVFESK
ncbi:hypothetical protein JTB14_025593 [Gonioctena quinquepunctata]|nr:hypothetical protein JTB14_025593 [Gonioctena quinquepunctata]